MSTALKHSHSHPPNLSCAGILPYHTRHPIHLHPLIKHPQIQLRSHHFPSLSTSNQNTQSKPLAATSSIPATRLCLYLLKTKGHKNQRAQKPRGTKIQGQQNQGAPNPRGTKSRGTKTMGRKNQRAQESTGTKQKGQQKRITFHTRPGGKCLSSQSLTIVFELDFYSEI